MNIPEGWKLVPVEPTEEMCLAAEKCKYGSSSEPFLDGGYTPENVEGLYKVMLAVAPTSPAQEAEPLTLRERTLRDLVKNRIVAQEDAPVAWMNDAGSCFLSDGNKYIGTWTPLYTHPDNSELRQAAAKVLKVLDDNWHVELSVSDEYAISRLRAALNKGKS